MRIVVNRQRMRCLSLNVLWLLTAYRHASCNGNIHLIAIWRPRDDVAQQLEITPHRLLKIVIITDRPLKFGVSWK